MNYLFLVLIFMLSFQLDALARVWTAGDGRTIEADLVRVDGEVAVLLMGGEEVRVPFSKLSEKDVEFLKEQAEKPAVASKASELFGVELKAGKTMEAIGDLDKKVKRELSGNKLKPSKAKVKISLPDDFDPTKPQKVFWVVGGINNEAERLVGNVGGFGRGNIASGKGWVVIAADTEHGNPRESTVKICEGDYHFHVFVVEEVTKIWPDFKTWKHACGGHSSSAKGAFFRMGQLLKLNANVVGGFFSGCNGAYVEMATKESKVRKSAWRSVKGFQSTGDEDNLVSDKYIKAVTDGMKSGGMRQLRSKTFPGGHVMSKEHFAEALDWFLEEGEE